MTELHIHRVSSIKITDTVHGYDNAEFNPHLEPFRVIRLSVTDNKGNEHEVCCFTDNLELEISNAKRTV
jgi:hypothetical protein